MKYQKQNMSNNNNNKLIRYAASVQSLPTQGHNLSDQTLIDAIAEQIRPLLEITFKLKCSAYKFVNLPINNLKGRSITQSCSLLTNLEAIVYDLKRIDTILNESAIWGKNPPSVGVKTSHFKRAADIMETGTFHQDDLSQHSAKGRQFEQKLFTPKFTKNKSFKIAENDMSIPGLDHNRSLAKDLNQTIKVKNSTVIQHQRANSTKNSRLKSLYQGKVVREMLNNGPMKIHPLTLEKTDNLNKSQEDKAIQKISSVEYVGFENNENELKLKIKESLAHRPSSNKPDYILSPRNSEMKSKIASDWEELYEQDLQLDRKNEEFLRKMQQQRANFLRHIGKKNEQCLKRIDRMKNLNSKSQIDLHKEHSKKKSRTEKLFAREQFQTEALDTTNFLHDRSLIEGI